MTSSTRVTAEYIAEESTLKLEKPLEGVENHARVVVVIDSQSSIGSESADPLERVSLEAGASLDAMIEKAFGPISR